MPKITRRAMIGALAALPVQPLLLNATPLPRTVVAPSAATRPRANAMLLTLDEITAAEMHRLFDAIGRLHIARGAKFDKHLFVGWSGKWLATASWLVILRFKPIEEIPSAERFYARGHDHPEAILHGGFIWHTNDPEGDFASLA